MTMNVKKGKQEHSAQEESKDLWRKGSSNTTEQSLAFDCI